MNKDLERRVAAIEARNKRVGLDKAWETSFLRRILIVSLTYIIMAVFMVAADIERPFINALIPASGFGLSTLTVSFVKNWWVNRQ
ncbi:MAG TPA: hypothetical protein VFX86_03750 [Candidatus Saccharimonadales bacterium]|nr:hypothetical protein [Candidatus Saccharimonadales bacterium]